MSACCGSSCSGNELHRIQRGTLQAVLAINAFMFMVMLAVALRSDSSALLADSLDNLGDALTYGLSLYVVASGTRAKARVALFKGVFILLAALLVLAQIFHRLIEPGVPVFELMGSFSLLALFANSLCLLLLWRHRHDDINMSSVWECSRNDIAANLSVFLAAAGVWLTDSGWPDLLVACALVCLLLRSAIRIMHSAYRQLRDPQNVQVSAGSSD